MSKNNSAYGAGGQVLSGPFFEKDLPDYQAAYQHYKAQWKNFLSPTQQEILEFVIDVTARFGNRTSYITTDRFYAGDDPNPAKGYAGTAPITPVSQNAFYAARKELERLGILVRDGLCHAIDYSRNAMHLATDSSVLKRVTAANRRGGLLSTADGVIEWAGIVLQRALDAISNAVCEEPTEEDTTYTLATYKTQQSLDKSSDNAGRTFLDKVRDYIMGERSTDDILSDVMGTVNAARDKIKNKQRKRRTLPDLCRLFESEWARGQQKASKFTPVAKILSRDRALLKNRIIKPFMDANVDIEKFAYWVAKHWQAIGAQHFPKSKNYPDRPAFRWLVVCIDTYVTAWEQREYLDESGTLSHTDNARKAAKVDRVVEDASKLKQSYSQEIEDLRAQLREAQGENVTLREELGMEPDDDPVYAATIKAAKRKVVIGNYDDDEDEAVAAYDPNYAKPKRRKLRKSKP